MTTSLRIQNLSVRFNGAPRCVIDNISFALSPGKTFALVGESGSGKSMTALSIMRLLPAHAQILQGTITLNNTDILRISEAHMQKNRGRRIGMIFQDPAQALNPVIPIGQQISEVLSLHQGLRGQALRQATMHWLERVDLSEAKERLHEFPFQFSGGQCQRIMIAMALAGKPDVLIADEPTTALDAHTQLHILNLLKELQQQEQLSLLLITHDLDIVHHMAHDLALMRSGKIVEHSTCQAFFEHPQHPYAQELLQALPKHLALKWQQARRSHVLNTPTNQTDQTDQAHQTVLSTNKVTVYYPAKRRGFFKKESTKPALSNINICLQPGKTLALVGESGSGKTTLAKTLLHLLPEASQVKGQLQLNDIDLGQAKRRTLKQARCHIQMVFQDPFASLNPRMTIGATIKEGMRALLPKQKKPQYTQRAQTLLTQVGLEKSAYDKFPHAFSGGQRQRIAIARALAVEPKVLVLDEPTSALDVLVQAHVMQLLKDLQQKHGLSFLLITHHFGVVSCLADDVAVMHQGHIVETGTVDHVLNNPQHHHTQELLTAVRFGEQLL